MKRTDKATAIAKTSLGVDLPANEEALFQLSDYPLLDTDLGVSNLGDEAVLKELLTMMIHQELPQELKRLEQAHKQSDWPYIEQLAHKLKSGAVYCGTLRLKMACQYLERYRKAGHSQCLEKLYLQLLQVAEQTEQTIIEWLQRHQE